VSFSGEIKDLFSWWGAEIIPLLNIFSGVSKRALVLNSPQGHQLWVGFLAVGNDDGSLTQGNRPSAVDTIFNGPHLKFQAATMRLPFCRLMEIARATVGEKTPFALTDVYVLPAPDRKSDRQSSFYVIKRERVDLQLAEITARRPRIDRWGLRDGDQVIWLPSRALEILHPAFHHIRHWRNGLLAAFAILIFAGGATYAHLFSNYSAAQQELATLVEARRTEALQVRKLLDRQQKSIAAIESARKGKAQSVPVVRVWEELTRILPDDAWLMDISIDGDMLTITGFAAESAAALIATLDASELFSAPNFTSPVVRIPGQSGERFEIRLRVQPA